MSTIWQYSPQYDDPVELIGFTVQARDGRIGSVDTAGGGVVRGARRRCRGAQSSEGGSSSNSS